MNEPSAATHGQVIKSAAEVYEEFFVPALFEQWPGRMLDAARVTDGDDVLDVGCGTGILARAAARRLGGSGSVTGIDINDGMLSVARKAPEPVTWRHGPAEHLPLPDHCFDRVVSQFALMFFADQEAGVREMARVARPGGAITIATWAGVDQSPGYAAMVELLQRLFGDKAANALMAPFTLGTKDKLHSVIDRILPEAKVTLHQGMAQFGSLEAWIHTDVRGWTLADMITDDQYAQLLAAAQEELAGFVDNKGRVRFPVPALIATAPAPASDHGSSG